MRKKTKFCKYEENFCAEEYMKWDVCDNHCCYYQERYTEPTPSKRFGQALKRIQKGEK